MTDKVKIGIIICNRYRTCAGGKCLRAMRNKEGAFQQYADSDVELVGYTTCDGCPGGNVEYTGEEMVKNGAQVIHLATGLLVGYPPCPYMALRDNPLPFGSSRILPCNLVAMITSSRLAKSFKARPSISSLAPIE